MRNSYAPIYGNPTISVPAKALTDLEPISIVFFGKRYDDENLITIAHQYEINTNYRIPPNLEKKVNHLEMINLFLFMFTYHIIFTLLHTSDWLPTFLLCSIDVHNQTKRLLHLYLHFLTSALIQKPRVQASFGRNDLQL